MKKLYLSPIVTEQHSLEVERLTQDNQALHARLRDVAHSPLSDSEKQQLLLDASRLHSSTSISISMAHNDIGASTTNTTSDEPRCITPEWDKHSSSSFSEISVACLQDRILQMEETHYSTNEELQATIQELSDLQAQLTELQTDNERLTEEKGVLLESLCRQTEKLEDSRSKVNTLQGLLLKEEKLQDSSKGYNTEREQKLVDLLKSAQEERESLLCKQEELTSELKSLRASAETNANELERLVKHVHHLELIVDSDNLERKQLSSELTEVKQESANKSLEINRLVTLLENARAKVEELKVSKQLETTSEADELLNTVRREKDTLETQAAVLQEQLARSHCDYDRLRDQYSQLQEEFKVTRNNAKSSIDDLEYRLSQLNDERISANTELQLVRDSLSELQNQCQRHLEDKRELKVLLSEAQRRERDAQHHYYDLEQALNNERKLRQEKNAEWEQFQNDLLMTVRVANDFKTEAQSELERVLMENRTLREKLRLLESQLEKLSNVNQKNVSLALRQTLPPTETQQNVLTEVKQEVVARRKSNLSRQDSRLSVKCLIESIENATKQAKAGPGSQSSSTSSLNSIGANDLLNLKSSLRDQQQISNIISATNSPNLIKIHNFDNKKLTFSEPSKSTLINLNSKELLDSATLNVNTIDFVRRNSITDLTGKDPLCGLVKNGGSKRNALLKWCQNKTIGYRNIDITNFSSSWNDGLALCAILHSYLPDKIPYDSLNPSDKKKNFYLAFSAAESVGIPTTLVSKSYFHSQLIVNIYSTQHFLYF
ncbi:GSCOCG00011246001-RA-CDS [Cotesia congregata]|nr:GSCOCG00011246001-RA-CDS [Cotesia congregata]